MKKLQLNYWDFIVEYLPYYTIDDRVLKNDILCRYIKGDEVDSGDVDKIKTIYKNTENVSLELEKDNLLLINDALEYYFSILEVLKRKLESSYIYYTNNSLIEAAINNRNGLFKIKVEDLYKQLNYIQLEKQNSSNVSFIDSFLDIINSADIISSIDNTIRLEINDCKVGEKINPRCNKKTNTFLPPTLLNASTATTFVFEIDSPTFTDDMMDEVNAVKGNRKIQDRINLIIQKGANLKFAKTESSVFENNLRMIDSCMPRLVSWMLADCYQNRDMNIGRAVERISEVNPLRYDFSDGHDFYGYKVKTLMVCIALGMLPATPWNGRYDATGGYIVVKNDGDVVCFHLYDRNLLEDYLFYNTKFETPSSSRYNMGEVYKKEGKYYFNLVMQIRFV